MGVNLSLLLGTKVALKQLHDQIEMIENEILKKIDVGDAYNAKYIERFQPVDAYELITLLDEGKEKEFTIYGVYQKYLYGDEMAEVRLDIPMEWLTLDLDQLRKTCKEIFEKENERKAAKRKVKEAFDNLQELSELNNTLTCSLIKKDK